MRGLICDDHPLMRQALVMALRGRWPGVQIDEAASYPDAWERAAPVRFLIVDLAMPGAEPCEGIRQLRACNSSATMVVLTGLADQALLDEVAGLGVTAILSKSLDAGAMLDRLAELLPELGETGTGELPPRQHEVLRLLGAGLTNKQIAQRLGIAPATVKIHVSRVIEQLGASNRTEAVSKAQRSGLI